MKSAQVIDWKIESFDPKWADFALDPYPYYKRLRGESPVHYIKDMGLWFVTGYNEAVNILSSPNFGKKMPEGFPSYVQATPDKYEKLKKLPDNMLDLDPPDHTRIRNLVAKPFTPRAISSLRPSIEKLVISLLDKVKDKGHMDIVSEFASPIPAIVIATMLGVPVSDVDKFRDWTTDLVRSFDATQGPEAKEKGFEAKNSLLEYFEELVEIRRNNPGEDLITELILLEEKGDKLAKDELLSMCILLLFAGYETTVNLIAVGIRNLLLNKEQLNLLKENPAFISNAVEEVMRYETPVQRIGYYTQVDTQIGDKILKKGDPVLIVVGAANRDEKIFKDADKLDITRSSNPHLGFGKGKHFCLGAFLARLEAEIAFTLLFEYFPNIKLKDEKGDWASNTAHRRLLSLNVIL
jgi:pimeloyl-[acyl-carrier protein] synthase